MLNAIGFSKMGHRHKPRRSKLNKANVILVKRWFQLGLGNTAIVAKLAALGVKVSDAAICDIRKGRNWGWVSPEETSK